MESAAQGAAQTAYHIVAAASPEALVQPDKRLWDSGKVQSADSAGIVWNGKTLLSRQRVYVAVRIWDERGHASAFSDPTWFELGLLSPNEWQARWIGAPQQAGTVAPASPFEGAAWIWFPGEQASKQAPAKTRYFKHAFALPAGSRVAKASLLATANDAAVLFVNGTKVARVALGDDVGELDVTKLIRAGANQVTAAAENLGGPAGLLAVLRLKLVDGSSFAITTGDGGWLASKAGGQGSKDVAGDDGAAGGTWQAAEIVAKFNKPPFEGRPRAPAFALPAPHLYREFHLSSGPKRSRVYISGLGYFELYINGKRVGDHVLDPAFTDYSKTVQYVTHDVTEHLQTGANAVGVVLGNGFYNQHAADAWGYEKAHWRAPPKLLFQLEATDDVGHETVIASDTSWHVTQGPTRFDGIRNGEHYDARLAHPRWAQPGFSPSDSHGTILVAAPGGKLVGQGHPPVRVTETLAARSVKELRPGVFLYDFGQNVAGWVQLRSAGETGTKITFRYGEKLDQNGGLDRKALTALLHQGEFETDKYTFKGSGAEELWEPRFSYKGFQYVEVTGFKRAPDLGALSARVINTDFPSIGSLYTSDPLVNQIHQATRASYEGNFHGIPTDCPHREKNGWTADAHLAADAGMFNYDNIAGYLKWLNDLKEAQSSKGDLPGIVPSPGWGYGKWSGPSWEIALFLVPWSVYTFTGDKLVLEHVFQAQQRYLVYLQKQAKGHLLELGLGDWVPWKTKTPVAITSTAHYLMAARLAAKAAKVLGRPEAEGRWMRLSADIFAAFQAAFVKPESGQVGGDEQTTLALAITHDLVPDEVKPKVLARLITRLEATDFHPDTGVIGAKALLRALSEMGRSDLAYKVASQTTAPSWGHWIRQGATTLWESWDGNASRNHIFFGDIDAWYYEYLAGIKPDVDQPGFAHISLAPQLVPGLEQVEAHVDTIRGRVDSAWQRKGESIRFAFRVPPNSYASVRLPVPPGATALVAGKPLREAFGNSVTTASDQVSFRAPAGAYEVLVRLPEADVPGL